MRQMRTLIIIMIITAWYFKSEKQTEELVGRRWGENKCIMTQRGHLYRNIVHRHIIHERTAQYFGRLGKVRPTTHHDAYV